MEKQPNNPQKNIETVDEKLKRFVEEVSNEPDLTEFINKFEPLSDTEAILLGLTRLSILRGDAIDMPIFNTRIEAQDMVDKFRKTGFVEKLVDLGIGVRLSIREYKHRDGNVVILYVSAYNTK